MSEPRYQVLGKVGQGGAGEVYLAKDTQLDRDVALKRVRVPEGGDADQMAQDLIREAKTLSTLQHPNIVTVYDVGKDEKGPFVVLEFLKGETLGDVIERGALPLEDFKEVVTQSLEGLIAAHSMGLIHRDLKSDNIMVIWLASGKFQIKILDFGLSKFSQKARPQTEDQGGGIMGSIFFMAPEQFERLPLDARTDMYSLGCIFYQILTTKYPFQGETGTEVMVSHLQHHVEPIQTPRPDLPDWLGHWVMWLISREMDDRPADARTALEYFRKQQHARPGVVSLAPPSQGAPQPRVVNPAAPQRPGAPLPARPNPGSSASQKLGTMATAKASMPQMQRTAAQPKSKSKLGLILTLVTLGVAVAGVIAFLTQQKTSVKPKANVASVPPLPAVQAAVKPAAPKKTSSTSPTPSNALFKASNLEEALEEIIFLPVKSSERMAQFKIAMTQFGTAYQANTHGKVLRQIIHDTTADYAEKQKDSKTAEFVAKRDDEKFVLTGKTAGELPGSRVESYPEGKVNYDPAAGAVVGWNSSDVALGFDLSLGSGNYEVTLVAGNSTGNKHNIYVLFGMDRGNGVAVNQTATGTFEEVNAGTFRLQKQGTHRLWIRAEAGGSGEIIQLKSVKLKKLK